MTQKEKYTKLAMQVFEVRMEQDLLAYSVTTMGLGDTNSLTHDGTTGDTWDDALSRPAWSE
jgi:hypothetical protein